MSEIFDSIEVREEIKQDVDLSFAIADQIHSILEKQGKTQRDLADLLGKKESEISKWLTGTHNFTTKSIAKIGAVLGERIILTADEAKKQYSRSKLIPVEVYARINKPIVKEKPTTTNEPIWKKVKNEFPTEGLKTA